MAEKRGVEKLPLPSCFMDDEVPDCSHHDNPSNHQGKTRSFPHVRGNWPTHVYIPVPVSDEFRVCIERFKQHMGEAWHPCDTPLHISVSRTVPVKYHWIDPLTTALQTQITAMSKFEYGFDGLSCYVNDEGTRSFLALDIVLGQSKFCGIVNHVDHLFRSYKLPTFYKPPAFHSSILWCLGNIKHHLEPQALQELDEVWSDLIEEEGCTPSAGLVANRVLFKTGNKLFTFELQ